MKAILCAVLSMTVTLVSWAQTKHTIIDATSLQVVAKAEILDSASREILALSNDKGEFTLPDFSGRKAIILTHPDFQDEFVSVSASDASRQFEMWPSSMKLDEVVISSSKFEEKKKEIAQQVSVISANDLAFRNNASMAEVLSQTGEVHVQKSQQGGGSPVLRGFETNKILLVVDGVRMNNAIYRAGHLQNVITVDNTMLDKVEVVYGPGSVVYGSDALGGVIHMHTRNPMLSDAAGMRVDGSAFVRFASANNENTIHTHFNLGGKKFASLTSITYSNFDDLRQGNVRNPFYGDWGKRLWYQDRIDNKDTLITSQNADGSSNYSANEQKGSGYHQYDILEKILFQQSKKVSHMLNIQFSNSGDVPRYDRLTQWRNGGPRYAQWYYGPQTRLMGAYQLNLKGSKIYDDARFILSYQDIEESRNTRNFNSDWLNHRIENVKVYSFNADLAKEIGKMELRYGAEYSMNDVTSTAHREDITNGTQEVIDTRYPDGGSKMSWFSLYASTTYEVNKKNILSAGLRFNNASLHANFVDTSFFPFPYNEVEQKNSAVSGSIGYVLRPGNDWKIALMGSSGYRVPNVDDIGKVFESVPGSLIVPNPDVKPETSYNVDLTLEKTFAKRVNVSVTGFHTWLTNAITWKAGTLNGADSVVYDGVKSQVVTQANTDKAYLYGGTARLSADITDNFTFMSTLTYTYGRIVTPKDSIDYPLDHIPPVMGRTGMILNLKKFKSEVWAQYNGWKRLEDYNLVGEDNISNATAYGMPAWCTLNARLSYQVMKNAALQMAVENILDQNYRAFASNISAPGRNLIITLRANW